MAGNVLEPTISARAGGSGDLLMTPIILLLQTGRTVARMRHCARRSRIPQESGLKTRVDERHPRPNMRPLARGFGYPDPTASRAMTCNSSEEAPVAELVDAADSKSVAFGRAGSSPAGGTIASQITFFSSPRKLSISSTRRVDSFSITPTDWLRLEAV